MYKSSAIPSGQSRDPATLSAGAAAAGAAASDCSVKVAVRVRPLLEMELAGLCSSCVSVVPQSQQVRVGNDMNFTFDHVFGSNQKQEDIMTACVEPLVNSFFEGFNATILAYGQTGSGKTFTMGSGSTSGGSLSGDDVGIIPRVLHLLFRSIQEREEQDPNCTFRVRIQFLEIYGEDIHDLLDPTSADRIVIRETIAGGVYVTGAREELVRSAEESLTVLERGSLSRTTGATRMNETSSRSHAIFTLVLEQTIHSSPGGRSTEDGAVLDAAVGDIAGARSEPETRKCKFHFVDLAGSERLKRTGAEGQRLKEGVDINKGLFVLGNVISALGDETKRGKVHVPYRDSKLTRMLQDSLGGNSKTLMICCVSPADSNYSESLNALKYANRARNIQNKPMLNIDPTVALIGELRKYVHCLAVETLWWRQKSSNGRDQSLPFIIDNDALAVLASSEGASLPLGAQSFLQTRNNAPVPSSSKSLSKVSSAPAVEVDRKNIEQYEKSIYELKTRCNDANEEVKRLTEAVKKQRKAASDASEMTILLQSERDYYRLKSGDGFLDKFDVDDEISPASKESTYVAEAEEVVAVSDVSASEAPAVVKLIAKYVREIEELKEEKAMLQAQAKAPQTSGRNNAMRIDSDFLDVSSRTSTVLNLSTADPMGEDAFDSNVVILENELTSSVARVISATQKDLEEEQKQLLIKMSHEGLLDEEAELIISEDIGPMGQKATDVEADDRAFRRRQQGMSSEIINLSSSIQLKEQLLSQLQRSQKQYEIMKNFYESKLEALSADVAVQEAEKNRLVSELQELSERSLNSDREEQLRVKLKEKEEQLKLLKKRQQDLIQRAQIQARSLQQISKLENDIEEMKRQRVDLMRTLHAEKKKHLSALNQKAREIERMKAELLKAAAEMKKVYQEKERAQRMTKDALREGADLRRRMNDIVKQSSGILVSNFMELSGKNSKRPVKSISSRVGGSITSSKRILSEEEFKMKRALDQALQSAAAREDAAESLRRQYEQQLALINQKRILELSRSSLRDILVGGVAQEDVVPASVSQEEEAALRDIEERIQNLDGQLMSRRMRIEGMKMHIGEEFGGELHDVGLEMLEKRTADSLPAAQEIIRLMFEMLVTTKRQTSALREDLKLAQEREVQLKEELEEGLAQQQILHRLHDQEVTRLQADYEDKLVGLLTHSDVSVLVQTPPSPQGQAAPDKVKDTKKASKLKSLSSAFIKKFRSKTDDDAIPASIDELGSSAHSYDDTIASSIDENATKLRDGESVTQLRGLLALKTEQYASLKDQLLRETNRVNELQSSLSDLEATRRNLLGELDRKECDLIFLQEECRMLREMSDEYKKRVLALENGQGESIVRTVKELDCMKRGQKGLLVQYGDDPEALLQHHPPKRHSRERYYDNDVDDDAASINSYYFRQITDEIKKTGGVSASKDSVSMSSLASSIETSIFDRLANPSYFTGTQKELFQRDLESKRAKVQRIKREENKRRNYDNSGAPLSAKSTGSHGDFEAFEAELHERIHSGASRRGSPSYDNESPLRLRTATSGPEDFSVTRDSKPSSPSRNSAESTSFSEFEPTLYNSSSHSPLPSQTSREHQIHSHVNAYGKAGIAVTSLEDGNDSDRRRHAESSRRSALIQPQGSVSTAKHERKHHPSGERDVVGTSVEFDHEAADVFSRLLNPNKFTGIHKLGGSTSASTSGAASGTATSGSSQRERPLSADAASMLSSGGGHNMSSQSSSGADVFHRLQKQTTKSMVAAAIHQQVAKKSTNL